LMDLIAPEVTARDSFTRLSTNFDRRGARVERHL